MEKNVFDAGQINGGSITLKFLFLPGNSPSRSRGSCDSRRLRHNRSGPPWRGPGASEHVCLDFEPGSLKILIVS